MSTQTEALRSLIVGGAGGGTCWSPNGWAWIGFIGQHASCIIASGVVEAQELGTGVSSNRNMIKEIDIDQQTGPPRPKPHMPLQFSTERAVVHTCFIKLTIPEPAATRNLIMKCYYHATYSCTT